MTWTQLHPAALAGPGAHQLTALAPVGPTTAGLGITTTLQAQQPITLTLPAR